MNCVGSGQPPLVGRASFRQDMDEFYAPCPVCDNYIRVRVDYASKLALPDPVLALGLWVITNHQAPLSAHPYIADVS